MSVKIVRLGDFVRVKTGKLDANASDTEGIYPFFTCSVNPLRINTYAYDCECVLLAGNGDLNVKYYYGRFNAYQRTYIIESLNTDVLCNKYLFRFMEKYVEILRQKSIGGVIKYIKLGDITEALIPLPPLERQREIAAVLDKVDDLRAKRRQSISKLEELLQSTFLEMFGDPVENPKGWDVRKLGEVAEIGSGSTPSREQNDYYGIGLPWIKTTEVNFDIIESTDEQVTPLGVKSSRLKIYPKESVIIAMYGQGTTRGKVAIAGIDSTVNQACGVITPNQYFDSYFLFCQLMLRYSELRELGRGGNQPNLNAGIIREIKIILPPLEQQLLFRRFYTDFRKQKLMLNTHAQQLNTLYSSLQAEFFGA